MNKSQLVKEVSSVCKLTQKECYSCLTALTEVIQTSLKKGEGINLVGFGKFDVKNRSKRLSYNPHTKTKVMLSSKKVPYFKAGKGLKNAVSM